MRSYAFAILALCMASFIGLAVSTPSYAQEAAPEEQVQLPPPTVIKSIRVVGNQRVEANTVGSYLLIAPGDRYSEERIDLSVKTLFATGLFADVRIDPNGGDLIIRVVENPIINRVILEGNKALKDDKITDELEAAPRSIFTRSRVQADVQRVIDLYSQSGRFAATVVPKVVQQPQNRVDLIFEITEGPVTGVKRINFIGNSEFSDRRLRKQLATKESVWYKFFSSNDNYDPNRLEYDREQVRTFYTDRGFADFRVVSAVAELVPNQKDFYITFTVDEGEEYTWGDVSVETELETLDKSILEALVPIKSGRIYKSSEVEDAIDTLTFAAGAAGYAFVDIQPEIKRNRETKTVDLVFNLVEGPRVYIERIDIVGNTTTLDYVIRRELELVEGDAFNRILLDRSRNRVRALRFFEDVEITEVQGATPDRAIVEVKVTEQPTGELSFSAGFSSADAFLVDLSITQRNLRGRGQLLRFVIRASSNRQEIDLRFTEPRFLNRNLAAGIEFFNVPNDFFDEAGFRSTRIGGQATLAFRVTDFTTLQTRYALRQETVDCTNSLILTNPQLCLQENNRLSSILGYTFGWDRRNDPITPTRGFDFFFSQDFAGVGGDVKYLRTEINANTYYGIFQDVIASAKINGGYITGWGGDNVQINDRFFKGSSTFRGFDNAGIGPRVVQVDTNRRLNALGGNAYGIASAEVSFPLGIPSLLGSVFIEAGTVGLLDDEFKVINDPNLIVRDDLSIRSVFGASVFWESPFGPIRFDFTKPIKKEDFDETESFQFNTSTRF
ncbi:MAG: outer membrane protein assembly factor BamA [Acidimicrobiales bacterium]|nr:MAG: outer membrane protein assembly factor BamA [Acidimicrobiales bacterium]